VEIVASRKPDSNPFRLFRKLSAAPAIIEHRSMQAVYIGVDYYILRRDDYRVLGLNKPPLIGDVEPIVRIEIVRRDVFQVKAHRSTA